MDDVKLLSRYKNQFIASCCVIASIFLIFQVIVPNIQVIQSQQQQNASEMKKLEDLNLSTQTLQSMSKETLERDLLLASVALPPAKDITGIYSSLAKSAAGSNIIFDGFTVSPGGIYETTPGEVTKSDGIPSVPVVAKVESNDVHDVSEFLKNFSTALPLHDVTKLLLISGSGEFEVDFFYKPYDLSALRKDVITPLTTSEQEILKMLGEIN